MGLSGAGTMTVAAPAGAEDHLPGRHGGAEARVRSPNQQKGDGDAATWLPPNKSTRCQMPDPATAVTTSSTPSGRRRSRRQRVAVANGQLGHGRVPRTVRPIRPHLTHMSPARRVEHPPCSS